MSDTQTKPPVIYVTQGWGVHDERWAKALETCGFTVNAVAVTGQLGLSLNSGGNVREISQTQSDSLISRIMELSPEGPILAGPINPIAKLLIDAGLPVVGLSWGYDLQEGHSNFVTDHDLQFLSSLSALIVDTATTAERALRVGVDAARIHVVPWGVDLQLFNPQGHKWRGDLPEHQKVIASLRNHEPIYRVRDILEAFSLSLDKDPDLRLVIAGSGSESDHLSNIATELGLHDHAWFCGKLTEFQIADLLRSVDCYVSASETDGSSVTLLQAMACGAPVVVSRNAGNLEWVTEGQTGSLFQLGDVKALSALMVDGPSRNSVITTRARVLVEQRADWKINSQVMKKVLTVPKPRLL